MGFAYKTYPPMGHQRVALRRAWPGTEFGCFLEMGTGKTYVAITLAAARFAAGQIDRMLIVCPTPIKPVWEEELEKHCPVPYDLVILRAGDNPERWIKSGTTPDKLKVFVVGIESLSSGGERTKGKNGKLGKLKTHTDAGSYGLAYRFISGGNCFVCIDESSRIKNYNSIRTKRVISLGGFSSYRMVLTGTPITQGLQDLYGQFEFLNSRILRCRNFTVFRNRYCIMGGFGGKKVLGYQFQDDLYDRVSPYIAQARTADCIDMPDQVYEKRQVEPTAQQKRAIIDIMKDFESTQGEKSLRTNTALERMTRYQQIIGGTFPYNVDDEAKPSFSWEPISGRNPKLDETMELLEDIPHDKKVLIFARFKPEVEYVKAAIIKAYGEASFTTYTGSTPERERSTNYKRFRQDPSCRFFITNQQVGGYGLDLVAAHYTLFYSNSFSYEDRKQSEFRTYRNGQTLPCIYFDIEMAIKHDKMILSAIAYKEDLATVSWNEIEKRVNALNPAYEKVAV